MFFRRFIYLKATIPGTCTIYIIKGQNKLFIIYILILLLHGTGVCCDHY